MIEGLEYIKIVKLYYSFLETEFCFKLIEEYIPDNFFYKVEYKDPERIISVSYENVNDYLQVIIYMLSNGEKPDFADKTKTLHLRQLNRTLLLKASKDEISINNNYFAKYNASSELERKLLKEAKELRFCLKHFNEL